MTKGTPVQSATPWVPAPRGQLRFFYNTGGTGPWAGEFGVQIRLQDAKQKSARSKRPGYLNRGAPKEKRNETGVYLADGQINQVGRYLSVFVLTFIFNFFYGVFVRFSTRGVQKHHKKLFAESLCQKPLAEKVEKKKRFSFRLFPSNFFYRVFGRFST
jgi:hypothetical protein